jgi:hypothetical protein
MAGEERRNGSKHLFEGVLNTLAWRHVVSAQPLFRATTISGNYLHPCVFQDIHHSKVDPL